MSSVRGCRANSFGDVMPTRCSMVNRPPRPLPSLPGRSNQNLQAGLPLIDEMKKRNTATPAASIRCPNAAPTATTITRNTNSDGDGRRNVSMHSSMHRRVGRDNVRRRHRARLRSVLGALHAAPPSPVILRRRNPERVTLPPRQQTRHAPDARHHFLQRLGKLPRVLDRVAAVRDSSIDRGGGKTRQFV